MAEGYSEIKEMRHEKFMCFQNTHKVKRQQFANIRGHKQIEKRILVILLVLCVGGMNVLSQDFLWKTGVYNFFDNSEFAKSKLTIPQTMAGVHLSPEIGLRWNDNHHFFAGFDAMHEYGSDKAINYIDPIAYYLFEGPRFRFLAGAFPRKQTLDKYPRIFFQDSINNYRPVVNGIFWEYASDITNINVWLDWVSRQTHERRESFFLGWSGRYNFNIFYGQHFGYMLHLAGRKNPEISEGLHDNILMSTSLGIDLSSKTPFEQLDANIGWAVGMERNRKIGDWNRPQGFLSEIKIEYKGLELYNTYYAGQSQRIFHNDHGSDLYWGDPMYHAKSYNRTDCSILFFKSDAVNIKFTWSLHFAEQTIYHQQLFNASFDLHNMKTGQKKYAYIWDNWLK